MKNKCFGIDMDGVLADFLYSYVNFLNKKTGQHKTKDDITSWHIEKFFGLEPNDKLFYEFGRSGGFAQLPPVDGALEGIKQLSSKYKVGIITKRPPEFLSDSIGWLDKYNIKADFFEMSSDKANICNIYGVTHFIDDYYDNCLQVANSGVETYLMDDRGYFRDNYSPNIIRVKSWTDFLNKVL